VGLQEGEMLTPQKRVMEVLRGGTADRLPFTVYECFVKPCTQERLLREQGMCVVWRTSSYRMRYKDIDIKRIHYTENNRDLIRTEFRTPEGLLTKLEARTPDTSWIVEYPFKSADDYAALKALFAARQVEADYDSAAALAGRLGEDYLVRDCLPLEPLQGLISGGFFDPQVFATEWYDNRDELLELYDLSVKLNSRCYEIIAGGPLETVNYGGNVVPQMIGPRVFAEYYMPHYEAACAILHRAGKLVGCHYDADNTPFMDLLARTPLDYIEAYDPGISPPLDKALEIIKGKTIWINWPSAWHLLPGGEAVEKTRELVRTAARDPRLIIGVTEDMPPDRWQTLCRCILEGILTA
jgi:hypothetical protein